MDHTKTFLTGFATCFIGLAIILALGFIAQKASALIGSWVNLPAYEVYVRFWIMIGFAIVCYVTGLLVREMRR